MATKPTITLHWERKSVKAEARTQSFSLRRKLRRIETEVNTAVTRTQVNMPEGLLSGNTVQAARALREEVATKGDTAIDAFMQDADSLIDSQDLMVLRMAEAIINIEKINADDPIRLQLEAGVLGEDGEVSEFWAEQDFEEVTDFVRRFRTGDSEG